MNIEFSCANCGAGLKVLKTFGGKTIQCPKCTKKTPVPPGADQPAPAPKPAPAAPAAADAKPATSDGVYIAFACGNCGSALKVLKAFAGKSIQCPKCTKKTAVPDPAAKEAAPAAEPAASAPPPQAEPVAAKPAPEPVVQPKPAAPPKPAVPVVPVVPAAAAPRADDARAGEQEKKIETLAKQMQDMELRLEVARLKAERAEAEKQELAARKEMDRARLQEELSSHFKAEIEAARRTIEKLEDNVREATRQRVLKASSVDGRTAAQIEKELLAQPEDALTEAETAVPDAVMAEIRQSRFSRYVRSSLLIHVLVLALTSIGVIKALIVKPAEQPAEDGGTNTVAAASAPAAESPAEEPAPAAEKKAEPEGVKASPESPKEPAPKAPAPKEPAPKAPAELEALPAPGEKPPTESTVNLGL